MVVRELGGPSALEVEGLENLSVGPGEVGIDVKAVGCNFAVLLWLLVPRSRARARARARPRPPYSSSSSYSSSYSYSPARLFEHVHDYEHEYDYDYEYEDEDEYEDGGLALFVGALVERPGTAIHDGLRNARMCTQGVGNDVLRAWVRRRGRGDQMREIFGNVSAGSQHEGMRDHDRRALFDASREAALDRRFGKLHVGDLDDAIGIHSGPHHLRNLLNQLVGLGASAAMVDQQDRALVFVHARDLGLQCSCVKNRHRPALSPRHTPQGRV